jgi:hypothetical protein
MQGAKNKYVSHEGGPTNKTVQRPTLIELKIKNHQFTEARFANLTVKGEGDTLWFNHKTRIF